MGNVLKCENCKYYESFGDPMNPRTDGKCRKLRLTDVGFIAICTEYDHFCSNFVKKVDPLYGRKEDKA